MTDLKQLNSKLFETKHISQLNKIISSDIENYIRENYNPANNEVLSLTVEMFSYMKLYIIFWSKDFARVGIYNNEINCYQLTLEQAQRHLDKHELNTKLQINLPPRLKTKVNKI